MTMLLQERKRGVLRALGLALLLGAGLHFAGFFLLEWDTQSGQTGRAFNQQTITNYMDEYDAIGLLPEAEWDAAFAQLDDLPFLRALMTNLVPIYTLAFLVVGLNLLRLGFGDPHFRAPLRPVRVRRLRASLLAVFLLILLVLLPIAAYDSALGNLGGRRYAGQGVAVAMLGTVLVALAVLLERVWLLRALWQMEDDHLPPLTAA